MGDHDQLMRSLRGKRGSQPNDEGSCLAALLRQEPRASASGSMTGSRSESSNLAALLRQRPAEVSSSQAAHDEEVQGGASLVSLLRPKRPRVAPVDEHSSLAALLASRGSEGYSKSSPRQTSPPHAASGQESGRSSDSSAFNLGWSRMSRFLEINFWEKYKDETEKMRAKRRYSMANRNTRQEQKDAQRNNGMSRARVQALMDTDCK